MNYKDAHVGQKVQYDGYFGKCTGTINRLFCPDILNPLDWGAAMVTVDSMPERWPYTGNDFAPSLKHLDPITEKDNKER